MKQILNLERNSHFKALYRYFFILKRSTFIALLLLFTVSSSIPVYSQSTYKSILNEIDSRGGLEIGQLEYKLDPPGWWQYYPSCDAGKWISVGDNFEPRADFRARCDLQIHDYESVVVPTLSETTELTIPADGRILFFCQVNEEEGYEHEPNIIVTVYPKNGNDFSVRNIVGGKKKVKPHPENSHYMQVAKGDKLVMTISARLRPGSGRRFFFPTDAKLRAFLFPLEGQTFSPDVVQAANQNVNSGASNTASLSSIPGYDHVSHGSLFDEADNKMIRKGEKVYFGHRLKNTTQETVWVTLSSFDESKRTKIGIKPNSIIILKHKIHNTNKSGVMLVFGRLWSLFKGNKGKPSKGFAVETYNSVSGVEGTAFEMAYDPNTGKTTVAVFEGKVNFSCKEGNVPPLMVTEGLTASFDGSCIPALGPLDPGKNTPAKAGWELPKLTNMATSNFLPPIADSHVYAYNYSGWNKANWGKYEFLGAGWHPTGGEKRAYSKFDVSGIDKDSFNKAVLRLYHYHTAGGNSSELGVYTVRSAWNEGNGTYNPSNVASPNEICWINQPTIDPYPMAYFNPGSNPNKFVEVDITTLVKSWLNGMPNYGLAIKAGENYVSGPESVYGFYSREYEDISKRPQLIINDGAGAVTAQSEIKKNYTSTGNLNVDKINSFEIPNLGGKYEWEHTQNINIPGEGAVVFEAKTVADLTIGFAENITDRNSMYEIVIGAFGNAKALIRKGAQTPPQGHAQVGVNTNKMASVPSNQWISYWASVKDGLVKFGRGKTVGQNVILEWQDPEPLRNISKVGFSSWNTPIMFRNVAIYNTANPVPTEGDLNNWPEIDIEEAMTIEKSGGNYSWDYLNNVKISGNAAFSFEARATEDLTVCFAEERDSRSAMYEIVIGGWGNTRTVIRKFRQNPQFGFANVTTNENPDAMITSGQWENYWISIKNGLVRIGKGNEIGRRVILEWQDPNNPLEYISTIGLMCWNKPYEIRNLKITPIY